MRTIYSVESGSYEEHEVHEMFEERADAEAWIVAMKAAQSGYHEPYEIVERDLFGPGEANEALSRVLYRAWWSSSWDAPSCPDEAQAILPSQAGSGHIVHGDGFMVWGYGETRAEALKACREYGYRLTAELEGLT